ncbi:MAG: PPE family protein [Mycobacterium sp.]|uniref:PPE family protein n=1 Tax=Mycobacterium sp. TaxID=1785 RepID=UPI003F99D55F
MFDFGALPPEINSGRIYSGPGSEPMMVAASAWDELAAELGTAASGYNSVVDELTGGPWVGPSSAAMVSAVVPYVSWISTAATQAEEAASQARAAAAAFEAAFAMTVPPPVIAANRVLLMTLIATNFFGQNTPTIAATEAQYMEMWAQDALAMYGYAATSAAATQLTPYQAPPNTTTPDGEATQFAAVNQAAAAPAGNSGQNAAAVVSQLLPMTAPNALQQLATPAASTTPGPFTWLTNTIQDYLLYGLPTPTNNWAGLTPANYTTVIKQTLQAYFGVGLGNFGWSIGQQTFNGIGTTAGAGGAWFPTPQFAGLHLGGISGVSAVSGDGGGGVLASAGSGGKVGMLSVPANWAEPTSEATLVSAVAEETPVQPGAMAPSGGPGGESNALLRGMPTGMVGRRTAGYGYTNKYGFKHSVLTRPPSAG